MPTLRARRLTGALATAAALLAVPVSPAAAQAARTTAAGETPTPPSPPTVGAPAGPAPTSAAPVVPGGRAARPAPPLTPAVVGVVRDSAGRPLGDVQVVVAALNRVAVTDDDGTFVLRGLPAGRHHLDAVLLGYARADVDVVVPERGPDVRVTIVMRRTVLRLQNVVVTASPVGADPLRLTQSTVELSGKELARSLGATVATTLANEPGMAMRFNGPAATTPIIRGLSGERILVLQDGDRAGDLSSSAQDHALSIDPLTAQRIEVVRGPQSLLYGTNALGGVVNVISNDIPTAVPGHVDGYVAAQAESVNPGAAVTAAVSVPAGRRVAIGVRGAARRADDLYQGGRVVLPNSFNRGQNGMASVGYVGDAVQGGLAVKAFGFDYGLPASPTDDHRAHIRGDRQEVRGRVDLALRRAGPLGFLRAEGSAQWYGHDEIEEDGAVGTRFGLRTQTLNLTGRTRLGRAEGAVGVQGLLRQYTAEGAESLTPAADTRNVGLFVYQELPLGRTAHTAGDADDHDASDHGSDEHARGVRLQLGARVDGFAIESRAGARFGAGIRRSFTSGSGSIGVSLPLADRVTLGLSAARAFRAPTVEELFSDGEHHATATYDRGNPNLRAETNQGVDAVLRAHRGRVDVQLSGYLNRIADYVTPTFVGLVDAETGLPETEAEHDAHAGEGDGHDGHGLIPLNAFAQRDARLYGAEGRVELAVSRRVVLGAVGDVVRGAFTAGGALPFLPPARLGALARWDDGRVSLAGEVRRAFAQDRASQARCGRAGGTVADHEPGLAGVPCVDLATAGFTLVNLSAGVNLVLGARLHSLTLRADNLLDEAYFDAASRIKAFARNPGRNVALVYRVQF